MSNATIPWQLLQLDPDTDAPKLMQDFEAILDWLFVEAIHRHHLQGQSFTYGGGNIAAGAGVGGIQSVTWSPAFPSGVVPIVDIKLNETGAVVSGVHRGLIFSAESITNTGCSVGVLNATGSIAPSGFRFSVLALDPTFDVSL